MRRPDRHRRRWPVIAVVGVLAAAAGLGGIGGTTTASAQDAPSGADLAAQFGGFELAGRANGVQVSYDLRNVLPIPSPLLQISVPEATATMSSGPSSFALGSVAYPGNLIANLPGVIGQVDPDSAALVPSYPIRSTANYPSGPAEASQQVGLGSSAVTATDSRSTAITSLGGADLPQFLRIGSVTTSAQSALVAGAAESRSRIELAGVDLLFGLLHFDSIVTDLVASSNGETADSEGTTTITGLRVLGLAAELGPDGLTFANQSQERPGGPLTPLSENLPDLGPVTDLLGQVFDPLNGVIGDLLESGTATLDDLLGAAGVTVRALEPVEVIDGNSVSLTANGLVVDILYDGRGDNPLAQLLALIPTDALPADSPPGIPLNVSPQALVNLLKETHITGFALGYGAVTAQATPAFEFTPSARPSTGSAGSTGTASSAFPTTPGFSTPAPALGGAAAPTTPSAEVPTAPIVATTVGVGALVVLALLTSPLWAVGSRRLADHVLGVSGASCPDGLDRPLPTGRA